MKLRNEDDLSIGKLWDINPLAFETPIRNVLNVARGELVLEKMISDIKEYWAGFEIELVRY